MPTIKILNHDEKTQFELQPIFDNATRKKFFRVTAVIYKEFIDAYEPIKKVGFILLFFGG